MKLRDLSEKDIYYQLEWMRDEEVVSNFQVPFRDKTYEDILEFVRNGSNKFNVHKAIVNEFDEYLGTISLKNIDYSEFSAEYAIVIRKAFWGKGVGRFATQEILNLASELGLKKVYLTVLESNIKAQKLYERFGFSRNSRKDEIININGNTLKNVYYEKFLGESNGN